MGQVTLITGGARSGKSAHAVTLARQSGGSRRFFLATAEPLDDEMRVRIQQHQADRANDFETIEEPLRIAGAISAIEGRADFLVLDCLTLWVSNLMSHSASDRQILDEGEMLADQLARVSFPVAIVTDEVGWGVVPDNPVGRRFRDLLGWTNQRIARVADRVLLMVAGLPQTLK